MVCEQDDSFQTTCIDNFALDITASTRKDEFKKEYISDIIIIFGNALNKLAELRKILNNAQEKLNRENEIKEAGRPVTDIFSDLMSELGTSGLDSIQK